MVCKEKLKGSFCSGKCGQQWVRKKNEVHLVTDGHDKKLNPKQPFFNLSSQPAAEKGRLSVKHNRVKLFLK